MAALLPPQGSAAFLKYDPGRGHALSLHQAGSKGYRFSGELPEAATAEESISGSFGSALLIPAIDNTS
jgi:hypothetical protein